MQHLYNNKNLSKTTNKEWVELRMVYPYNLMLKMLERMRSMCTELKIQPKHSK